MPAPVYAPRMDEPEQRAARIRAFLTQLGIDARQLDDFLRNPYENVGTPLEAVRAFRPPNMEDPTHVASSLAGALLGGRESEAAKCRGQGIIAFCGTDEEASQFLGRALEAYSRVLGQQGISEDTLSWLGRIERRASEGGALQRTVLSSMSIREQRRWVDENLDTLARAAIFQARARSRGVDPQAVEEVGRRIYGGLWGAASAIGMNLKLENGAWRLHGARRGEEATTSRVMDALRGLEPLRGRGILSLIPTRGEEAAAEMPAEERFDAYYERIQRHPEQLFSRGARTIFSEWVRDYNKRFGGGLSAETLSEATAFYLWATKIAGLDAEEMERIGKGRYGGTWELAGILGRNFGETEAGNYGVLGKNRAGLEEVQLAFGRVRGRENEHFVLPAGEAEAVAAVQAAAEVPAAVAERAGELGVNATFLNALVNLIKAGYVNLAMYYVGESESGNLDGSLQWINGLYAKPRPSQGGEPYYIPYNESILPPAQAQSVLEAAFGLAGVRLR